MELSILTVEEENLICVFDITDRLSLTADIKTAIPDFEEPELKEIAQNIIRKLDLMTDEDFSNLTFSPAYHGDEDNEPNSN